jgi:hypothetical protein
MADVFVSYKRDHRREVAQIAERLQALGVSVWYDAGLTAGEQYRTEIKRELGASSVSIACWTPACFDERDEGWVRWEAQYARNRGRLVPIFLQPTELEPPFHLDHVEDLTNWVSGGASSDHDGWRRLLLALEAKLELRGLWELDEKLAPVRAHGVVTGVAMTPTEAASVAAKLDQAGCEAIAAAFERWRDGQPRSQVKRAGEVMAALRAAHARSVEQAKATAQGEAIPEPASGGLARPARDDKGRVLVRDERIKTIPAMLYGLSMLRARPFLMLSLYSILLLTGIWNMHEMERYVARQINEYGDYLVSDPFDLYRELAVPYLGAYLVAWLTQSAMLRALIRGEGVSGVLGLNLGADELRLAVVNIATLLLGALLLAALGAAVAAAYYVVQNYLYEPVGALVAGGLVGLLSLYLFSSFLARVTPIASATIARRRFAIVEGWKLGGKATFSVAAAYVLLLVGFYIIALAITAGASALGMTNSSGVVEMNALGYVYLVVSNLVGVPFAAAYYGIGAYIFIQRSTAAR